MNTDSLRVDLADMDDVRAQLPRARDVLRRKRTALEHCQADYESFRELVELLAKRAGVELEDAPPDTNGAAPESGHTSSDVLGLVVDLVNERGGPIRARDVKTILVGKGHNVPGDAVRDALYYAAKRREPRLLQSLPERGYYAPLSYRREQDPQLAANDGISAGEGAPAASPVTYGGSGP